MSGHFWCGWCARRMLGREGGHEFLNWSVCIQEGSMPRRNSLYFPYPCAFPAHAKQEPGFNILVTTFLVQANKLRVSCFVHNVPPVRLPI